MVEWIEIAEGKLTETEAEVSTLVVEWIEMWEGWKRVLYGDRVSTLVVEWIEIFETGIRKISAVIVSTLVVEWIEIFLYWTLSTLVMCLHPRGGVD